MSEKKGFLSGLFGGKKSGGCCNMEIVEESGCCETDVTEEPQAPSCGCGCDCSAQEDSDEGIPACGCSAKDGELSVKVLGSGCASCHTLLEHTETAVKNMGLSVSVEYITDMKKVMEYGVMRVPALVVNEKVVSMGKVLKPADIEKLLHKLGF